MVTPDKRWRARTTAPNGRSSPSALRPSDHKDQPDDDHANVGSPLSTKSLEETPDANDDDDGASSDGANDPTRPRRRTTSAFNRSNGLVLSATYLTTTYGGAPAYYSLWLGEQCTSTVVVHLQFLGDARVAKAAGARLSCDRLEFTPLNFHEPQIVRVEMVEYCGGTHMVLHRVFSLDKNYDRLNTPNVVVKTERSRVGSLLSLGGAVARARKNARGEDMTPRRSANRTIDLGRAVGCSMAASSMVASLALTTGAAAAAAAAYDDHEDDDESLSRLSQPQPLEPAALPVFVSHLAAGHSFSSVVVKPQGGAETMLMWGKNASGELGVGSTTSAMDPVPLALPLQLLISEPFSVVSISCGKHHAALVTTHGRLFTWGNNKHGQLGLGDFTNSDAPREVVFAGALFRAASTHQRALRIKHALDHGATNVTQVACGASHTLFVTHQQHVLAMGYNQAGQLGLGHRLQQLKGWRSCTPAMVETLRDSCILDLAAGQNHSACVLSNGDVYVWGCGSDGRLGVPLSGGGSGPGSRQNQSECELLPVPVLSLKDISVRARSVRCGARHTAILSDRDLLYVWGANEFGQLGLGDKRTRMRPCLVQFAAFLNDGVVDVALGEFHSACVTWSGDAYVWGLDLSGEQSTRLHQRCSPELVQLPENESAIRVACGWAHTTVVTQEESRDSSSNERGSTSGSSSGSQRPLVHVHRRKEKARQFATRQQEIAKWRRVSTALAIMGRLQRRVSVWREDRKMNPKDKQVSLAQVVSNASSKSDQWQRQQEQRARQASITAAAEALIQSAVQEATKRVLLRPRSVKQRKNKNRPASMPGRRTPKPLVHTSEPNGVFYHNALQLHSPPSIPPTCLLPPASSPRHMIVAVDQDASPWFLKPTPSPLRSRATRPASPSPSPRLLHNQTTAPRTHPLVAPLTTELSSSSGSPLPALHGEPDVDEEIRPPAVATLRGSSRLRVVESLLHKPSFSLTSRLTRGVRSPRVVRSQALR